MVLNVSNRLLIGYRISIKALSRFHRSTTFIRQWSFSVLLFLSILLSQFSGWAQTALASSDSSISSDIEKTGKSLKPDNKIIEESSPSLSVSDNESPSSPLSFLPDNQLNNPRIEEEAIGYSQRIWLGDYSFGDKHAQVSYNGGASIANSVFLNSGMIRAAAIAPGDPQTAYYLTTSDNVSLNAIYKTTNGGQTYTRLTGFSITEGQVTDIAINPSNPQDIYIGWINTSNGKAAVYRSTNGGISWIQGGYTENGLISSFRIAVNNRGTIIAAVNGGSAGGNWTGLIYRSINGGQTWDIMWTTTAGFGAIRCVTFSYSNPSIWYATVDTTWGSPNNKNGIIKSSNDGYSWEYHAIPELDNDKIFDLAVDSQNENLVNVISVEGIYRSTNGGASWTLAVGIGDDKYGWRIRSDPANGNVFWMVGYLNDETPGPGLFRSIDGGSNWSRVRSGNYVGGTCCGLVSAAAALEISSPPPVPERSTLSQGSADACFGATYDGTQAHAGGPINTRTGGYDYSVTDLSIPTSAGPLSFQRTYSSLATGIYTTTLGYGWTHSLDTRLIFSNTVGGSPGVVFFKAHTANQYQFWDNRNGTYTSYAGLCATLTRQGNPATYTLKDKGQLTYIFDSNGKLTQYKDAQGHLLTYSYDANNRLVEVEDDTGDRYFELAYADFGGQTRLQSVQDQSGRSVFFNYNLTNGNLVTVTNALAQDWTYLYTNSSFPHHLTEAKDPAGKTIERTVFDVKGRAVQQFNGNNQLNVSLGFIGATTTITQIVDNRNSISTHLYDARNALTKNSQLEGGQIRKTYDMNFRPTIITDVLTHTTTLNWSSNGANLTQMVDAAGDLTRLNYDSLNNVTAIGDGQAITTTYTYNGSLLLRSTDALGNATIYSYTTAADAPAPSGLLKASQDANGNVTQYNYDAYGQRISTTDALGQTTNYSYDDLGRLIKTTSPDGRTDWTCYDFAGRVTRTVLNASGDGSTPATDPCDVANYQSLVDGLHDHIIQNSYDLSGNLIASTDPAGRITRTYYDNAGRAIYTVQNLQNWVVSNPSPPPLNLRTNEANLTTKTSYDASGKVIAVTESIVEGTSVYSQTNRTYYDSLGRPEYQVENLTGQDIAANSPPSGSYPADQNVTTRTYYDAAGNPIATKDPLGRITRTYYDALNRPSLVVQNWSGSNLYSTTPPTCNRGDGATTNICNETFYDQNGNAIATRDAKEIITRTYFDAVNRPVLVVRSLTSQAYNVQTLPSSSTFDNSHDVATQTVYDPAGNAIASIEWLKKDGQVIFHTTRTYYDPLQRPVLVVRNLDPEHSIQDPNPPECNRDASGQADPVNVCTQTVYDPESGDTIASLDPLGRTTRTWYDELHRPTLTIRNLTSQGYEVETPPAVSSFGNSENVASQVLYDSQGRAIASIQWQVKDSQVLSTTTRTFFDGLDRPVSTIQNYLGDLNTTIPPAYDPGHPDQNVRTDALYTSDSRAMAQIEWLANASGQLDSRITRSYYDGVKRVTQTVQNIDPAYGTSNRTPPTCNRDANGTGPITNVCFQTSYRADGSSASSTNPLGKTTNYSYDTLGRLTGQTDPLSHTTSFGYDANGNRVSLTDAKGTLTKYEYDALNRLNAVVENYRAGIPADDQTNLRTEYTYDALGNRLSILDGEGHPTTFSYDALGRQQTESDALGHTWSTAYDVNGNRVRQTDANSATTTYSYDGLDRLVLTDYPDPDADVSLSYDAFGERTEMVDGLGTTSWQFDGLGRAITITQPISGTVGYAFNALGNRTRLRYPDGKQVQYEYDKLGRLSRVTDWDSRVITYSYNVNGAMLFTHLPNDVASAYTYDEAGQVTQISHTWRGVNLSKFIYHYDPVGNRDVVTETLYTRSHMFMPVMLKDSSGSQQQSLMAPGEQFQIAPSEIDGIDNLSPYPLPGTNLVPDDNLLQTSPDSGESVPNTDVNTYPIPESSPLPDTIPTPTPDDSSSPSSFLQGVIEWVSHWFGQWTQPASAHESESPLATTTETGRTVIHYTYDPLNRLTTADYSNGKYFHYTYDSVGNRLVEATDAITNTYGYDNANRLMNVNNANLTWDNNGNLLNDGSKTYTYDKANRLVEVTQGTDTYSYSYNGQGDRYQQTENGITTNYTLDINAGLTQVLSDGTFSYLYGNSRLYQQGSRDPEYFLGDALGSVRQIVDRNGDVILQRSYQPYGSVSSFSGIGTTNYGFTGEWTDTTNLLNLRARYFAAWQGRFINRDTWKGDYAIPLTQHLYLYALNNPNLFSDPSGHAVLAALMPSLIGGAAGFLTGATAGGIYGLCTYEWALAGQCGCDLQTKALSMTKWQWVGAHALGAGIIGGVAGAIAAIAPVGLIIVGGIGLIISGADFINTVNIIRSETGFTWCTVTRLILDIVGAVFSATGILEGLHQWRTSGGALRWYNNPASIPRDPLDIAIEQNYPKAPPANNGDGVIGGSFQQNADVKKWVSFLNRIEAEDIRVNQEQVNANLTHVGINRPDLQFTLRGQRFYIEWDSPLSNRGLIHSQRIQANDPSASYVLYLGQYYRMPNLLSLKQHIILITMP